MSEQWLPVLPIAIPMIAAILALLVGRWHQLQAWIGVLGAAFLVWAALSNLHAVLTQGILAVQMGTWAAPFGITLVVDKLSAGMLSVTAIMALIIAIFALADMDHGRVRYGFFPFMQILIAALCGAFITGDIFNMYVWFEVMLISSFALLVLGGDKLQLDGAVKYVALNLISTVLFLGAVGLLYGLTGTLNMAALHSAVKAVEQPGLLSAVAVLFILGFGIKAAIFPLFFWLPASYHTPPVTISALFGALLTKVGVYAILRVFTLIFTIDVGFTHGLLMWLAGFTMAVGVAGAIVQNELRRLLSFQVVAAIGYMIMGVAIYTPLAIVGTVFYVLQDILVKGGLFFTSGVLQRISGSNDLRAMGGLYRAAPLISAAFMLLALSLAGFPPLAGFWAKLTLVRAGLEAGQGWIVLVALAVGLLTIYSMMRVWSRAFWHPNRSGIEPKMDGTGTGQAAAGLGLTRFQGLCLLGPVLLLAVLVVVIGLWAGPFLAFAEGAAQQLVNPEAYVAAVLGGA